MNANAVGAAGFAALGRGRGRLDHDRITAFRPSEVARAEQFVFLESARGFDPVLALEAITTNLDVAGDRPLLVEIMEAIGERYLQNVSREKEMWLRVIAAAAGTRSERAKTLVVNHKGVVHIWPDGANWEGPLPRPESGVHTSTVCGQAIVLVDHKHWWQLARRGNWQDPAHYPARRVCKHCARHASEYPDCQERDNYPPFGVKQTEFEEATKVAFRKHLIMALRADEDARNKLFIIGQRAYRETATEFLLDAIEADATRVLAYITNNADIEVPDREGWRAALEPLMEHAFLGGVPRTFENWERRRMLAASLGVEIKKL
jgi:hypothetical protein